MFIEVEKQFSDYEEDKYVFINPASIAKIEIDYGSKNTTFRLISSSGISLFSVTFVNDSEKDKIEEMKALLMGVIHA